MTSGTDLTTEDEAPPSEPPGPRELPPEIAALPTDEFNRAWRDATIMARSITKSRARADDVMSTVLQLLLTTRRWDPARGPLFRHLTGALKSVLSNEHTSKAPEREALVHEAYHREVRPLYDGSAEDMMLERAEEEAESARAEQRRAAAASALARLEARVRGHEVARGVLRCKSEGIEKAADIAVALGVPVAQVYRAMEMLKYHLTKIRAEGEPHP